MEWWHIIGTYSLLVNSISLLCQLYRSKRFEVSSGISNVDKDYILRVPCSEENMENAPFP